jgi:tetratricopeptide (TPR) repeat protein
MSAFERAMQALQRHDYSGAAASFRHLIESFPGERGLLDRARVYLDLCQRELDRQPPAPQTLEERLTAATAALNLNDDREAERLARLVLGEDPERDLAVYLLAAIEARRGNLDQALQHLSEAIAISPDVRAQARHDEDFAALRDSADFHRLTGISEELPSRRARHGRAER